MKLGRKYSYQSAVPSAVLSAADPKMCRDVFRGYLLGSYSIAFAPHQEILVYYVTLKNFWERFYFIHSLFPVPSNDKME